jgi:outer membrane protein TolC
VAWQHHVRWRRLWLRDRSRRQAEISGRLADVVQRRFEAGDASGLELDLARIEAAEGRQRVFAAERALAEMEATLAAAIGWPNGTTLPEPDSLELVPGFPDTVDLASRALAQRPDLVVARAAAEWGIESARHANSRLLPAANVGVFGGQDDGEDIRGMRVGLSVPFLGPPLAERGARGAEKRRLEAEMQAATRDAAADVTATRAAAALSFEQVSLYQSAILPGIQSARQRYEEAYTVGQIDLTTMLLGEQRYRDAERSFAEVLGTYIDALRDLEVATGLPALSHAELDEDEKP